MQQHSLEPLYQWFDHYAGTFRLDEPQQHSILLLKADHSKRVAAEIVMIAQDCGLHGRELVLAEASGLLHDVGRFEQFVRFRTFNDRISVNHGQLGVKVLHDTETLKSFLPEEREVIVEAISHHNSLRIPDGLGKKSSLMTKLLRDADKLDIYRILIDQYLADSKERNSSVHLGVADSDALSPEIIAQLMRGEIGDYRHLKTLNDFKLLQLGWVYDINCSFTLRCLMERGYFEKIYATLPRSETTEMIYARLQSYIHDRITRHIDTI